MIIYVISPKGVASEYRTKVRNWKRDLNLVNACGYYIDGVGFERPFDEFQKVFRARHIKIVTHFMNLNAALRETRSSPGVSFRLGLSEALSRSGYRNALYNTKYNYGGTSSES